MFEQPKPTDRTGIAAIPAKDTVYTYTFSFPERNVIQSELFEDVEAVTWCCGDTSDILTGRN